MSGDEKSACRFELCHRFAIIIIIFILVMFVAQIFIVVGSAVRNRFKHYFFSKKICTSKQKATALCILVLFLLSFDIICAYFAILKAVSFDNFVLRVAAAYSITVFFSYPIDLMLFLRIHSPFSIFFFMLHVLVC